jgi:non-ribosomal peptide synthetase component F
VIKQFQNDLFTTFTNFRGFNFSDDKLKFPFKMEKQEVPHLQNYDIAVNGDLEGDTIHITAYFNKQKICESKMNRLLKHFGNAMKSMVQKISQPLKEIESSQYPTPSSSITIIDPHLKELNIMDSEELSLLENGVAADSNTDYWLSDVKYLHEILEYYALSTPLQTAIQFENEDSINYFELNNLSNMLAWKLKANGVGSDILVPICADRSILMVAGILGILKSGGAYVPIDPSMPVARVHKIINQCNATVCVLSGEYSGLFEKYRMTHILLDELRRDTRMHPNPYHTGSKPSDLAYVIFTSGSTGEPKGVMIEHSAAVESVLSQRLVYEVESQSKFLQYSNFTFDVSVGDFFIPMAAGACICMASKLSLMNDLSGTISKMNIDHAYLTVTVASMLKPEEVPSLKTLAVGAEVVTRHVIESWADNVKLLNIYGNLNIIL